MPPSSPGPEGLVPSLLPVVDGISGPWGFMALLLYATFVLHLLLMNAVVGTALLTLLARLRRRASAPAPSICAEISRDTDVLLPKGVAFVVNLGIPPFLFLQAIYGQYIYSSSVLMALWWLSVMLVVMLAYYGFYINMARRALPDNTRTLALGIAVLLLLWNAFLFVNNMTLMQNPESWQAYAAEAGGTFLNLGEPQLVPRYLHVILSCLAVGGLCLALPAELIMRGRGEAERLELEERRNRGLTWFTHATLAQIPVGLWFFMALPRAQRATFMGGNGLATLLFGLSLLLTLAALVAAWKKRATLTTAGCVLLVALMAGMRTQLRGSYLEAWYAPAMKAPDAGPLLLFLASLALSGIGLFFMLRMYFRHSGEDGGGPLGPEQARRRREELHDVLLVNEIAPSRADLLPDDGHGHEGGRS